MTAIRRSLFLFLLALWLPRHAWAEAELIVLTDNRHPLAWIEKGKPRGIAYDLVVATMKELGLTPTIEFVSFTRGMKMAQHHDNYVFFSVTRTPERSNQFKWAGPLLQNDIYVYKLKGNPAQIRSLADLEKLGGVGVPKGMSQDTYLTNRGLHNIMRSDTLANTLRSLVNKRVDAIAMGQATLPSTAKEIGLEMAQLEETPLMLYENPLHIAFSKNVSDETVQRWQKALDKVKQEKYKQLINTYLR